MYYIQNVHSLRGLPRDGIGTCLCFTRSVVVVDERNHPFVVVRTKHPSLPPTSAPPPFVPLVSARSIRTPEVRKGKNGYEGGRGGGKHGGGGGGEEEAVEPSGNTCSDTSRYTSGRRMVVGRFRYRSGNSSSVRFYILFL